MNTPSGSANLKGCRVWKPLDYLYFHQDVPSQCLDSLFSICDATDYILARGEVPCSCGYGYGYKQMIAASLKLSRTIPVLYSSTRECINKPRVGNHLVYACCALVSASNAAGEKPWGHKFRDGLFSSSAYLFIPGVAEYMLPTVVRIWRVLCLAQVLYQHPLARSY